ncbi:TPA: hypothetical protein ACVOYR_004419, partial [Vibrio alginolyticus]
KPLKVEADASTFLCVSPEKHDVLVWLIMKFLSVKSAISEAKNRREIFFLLSQMVKSDLLLTLFERGQSKI